MSCFRVTTGWLAAILLLGASALLPVPARAWGNEGHKAIALIAYRHLTPPVRHKVDRLLRRDKDRRTRPDFASRATWADRYRDSDHGTTRKHYDLTYRWHFVDLELDHPDLTRACFGRPPPDVPASAGPAKACVVDRINAFAHELRTLPFGSHEQIVAFKFLLHLVGDVHQPLHAADNHDQGGNKVLVLFGRHVVGQPLHAYWDTAVVKQLGATPRKVAAAVRRRFGSRCHQWMSGTPADWAWESFAIARHTAYRLGQPGRDRHGDVAYRLSPQYQRHAATAAAEQIEKAGCRLAMVLNRSLR